MAATLNSGSISELFTRASSAGVQIALNGDKVRLAGPPEQIAEFRPIIAERKADIIAWIRSQSPATVDASPKFIPRGVAESDYPLLHWLTDWLVHPDLDKQGQVIHQGKCFPIPITVRQIAAGLTIASKRDLSLSLLRSFRLACMEGTWRSGGSVWPDRFDCPPRIERDDEHAPARHVDTSKIAIAPPRMRQIILVRGPGHCDYWYVERQPIPPWAREHRVGCCDGWEAIPDEWWSKYGHR